MVTATLNIDGSDIQLEQVCAFCTERLNNRCLEYKLSVPKRAMPAALRKMRARRSWSSTLYEARELGVTLVLQIILQAAQMSIGVTPGAIRWTLVSMDKVEEDEALVVIRGLAFHTDIEG